MFLYSYIYVHLKTKSFFWFGITIGILFSFNLTSDEITCDKWTNLSDNDIETAKLDYSFEPKVNLAKKPLTPKKTVKTINRPRYYSTELGIREKLFVGVLTSFDNLDSVGISINVTLSQYVNKIKYFVQVLHNQVRNVPLNNVVGFTDTREAHRPFHIFKYIADNFIQDYDYFFIMPDKAYINGNKLRSLTTKISITEDVYTGMKNSESSYCSLDAGILFSNSVIKKIRANLEWCIKNAISNEHSDNIGRCAVHAIGQDCQESVQGQQFTSFKAQFFSFQKHLKELVDKSEFNNAVSVYPIVNANDIYILHSYFSKQALIDINEQINELRKSIQKTVHLHPPQFTDVTWPIGSKRPVRPENRYDLLRYDLINQTHIFMRDDFRNIAELTRSEREDVEMVLDAAINRIYFQYGDQYKYRRLINGYRLFDPSRGLSYILDIGLKDKKSGKEVIKRMEVAKILGQSEILPVPYVTENSRVTIVLPILETESLLAIDFLNMFGENIMTRREKSFLMLSFLYGYDAPSKGNKDIFNNVKKHVQKINEKYKTSNSGIAWVSIRFPSNDIDRHDKRTIFSTIDLSLRKIGVDALVLYLDVYADVRYDFLNRVRMNTILDYQTFFPIPFAQYNPIVSDRDDLDINKNVGQFDSNEYNYFSFYGRDYIKTRRKTEKLVPIIRTDKDIANIMNGTYTEFRNVFEYFIKNNDKLHYFRSIEPSLKIKYRHHCSNSSTIRLGSKVQLAQLILEYNSTLQNTVS